MCIIDLFNRKAGEIILRFGALQIGGIFDLLDADGSGYLDAGLSPVACALHPSSCRCFMALDVCLVPTPAHIKTVGYEP